MKTIIVPVDFSKNSDAACHYALDMAKDFKSKVILIHAFESTVLYSKIPLVTAQLDYSYLYNAASKKLKDYYHKISKYAGKVNVELNVQAGLASSRIVELASEKKADLIVIGTTGKDVVERVIMGSNAARTIREAPCMVLAIPPKAKYNGFKRIVYATDLTNDNLKHSKKLIPISKKYNGEIFYLNIGQNVADGSIEYFKKVKSRVNKIVHYSKTAGFIASDFDINRGIDYFLKYHKADCLAVYTHHRSLLSRLFNISVAKSLSIHTSIPLLVIHEEDAGMW